MREVGSVTRTIVSSDAVRMWPKGRESSPACRPQPFFRRRRGPARGRRALVRPRPRPPARSSAPAASPATSRTRAGVVEAVRGLDLDVAEGELVAFLGPNGAGKSTTPAHADDAAARRRPARRPVAGHDVAARARRGAAGASATSARATAPGRAARPRRARQPGPVLRPRRARARARAGRRAARSRSTSSRSPTGRSSTLSGGQRRRLDVAIGLVHAPRLLFLDEPSTGLDPQNRANLWEHILRLRAEHGMTIVLTTHYLDEADTMAERVMVMDHGRDHRRRHRRPPEGRARRRPDRGLGAATGATPSASPPPRARWCACARCASRRRRARPRRPTAPALVPVLLIGLDAAGPASPRRSTSGDRPSTTSSSPSPDAACARSAAASEPSTAGA